MKRIFLLILLFLFAFTFMFTSASAEILTIWDDVNNLDGIRPAGVIYRINGDVVDPDNPPSDWQSITADTIPGYTVTGPIYQDDHIVFIHHHKPASKAFSVTNNLKYATLTIAMNVTDSGPDEEFRVRLQFGLPGEFKCAIGDTEREYGWRRFCFNPPGGANCRAHAPHRHPLVNRTGGKDEV